MALSRRFAHGFLVACSLTTVFLFSGTVFGWGAFSAMLEKEGFYSYQCKHPDPDRPCDTQIQSLNTAFTLASTVVSLSAFANGWLVDTLGPTKVTILAGIMSLVGLLGIAFTRAGGWTRKWAEEGIVDVFLWSTVLTALGGSLTMFIGYQAPFVVPSRFTLLIEINSCLFDAGTIIFPILKMLYDLGVPFAAFFWTYVGLAAICYTLFAIAWGLNEKELLEIKDAQREDRSDGTPECERPLNQRSMKLQVKTFEFAAIFIYSIVMVPRSNLYMETFGLINRHIANETGELANLERINDVIGFIIPFGFLAVPLIEMSIHRLGTIRTIQLTTALGLVYNALQLVSNLHLQIAAVAVFAVWRAYLYSVISAFNGETFGVKTMGRIMGLCFFFSGVANLVIGPLSNAAVGSDDFLPLLVGDLLICAPLPFLFVCLQRKLGRQEEAREPLAGTSPSPPSQRPIIDPMGAASMTRTMSSSSRQVELNAVSHPIQS